VTASVRAGNGYLLTVLTVVSAMNWADRQVVPILFPGIRAELGLTDTQLGIVAGLAFSLVYAVAGFGFGVAADRAIRVHVIAFGLTAWSAATAAGAFATDFTSLFWARFFTGIGEASLFPCAVSLIGERFPAEQRGRALGIFGMAAAIGSGLGIGLGGRLAETLGWRSVFLIYGGTGLLLLPLVLSLPEERRARPAHEHQPSWRILRELVGDRRLLTIWLAGCVAIASGIGFAAWAPSYFVRHRGMDVSEAGALFGGGSLLGGILGSVAGGLLADRRRRVRPFGEFDVSLAAALLAAPLVLLTIGGASTLAFVSGGLLGITVIYAVFPPLQAVMVSLVPKERHGMASALNVFFIGGLGSALGPFVVGAMSDLTGSLATAMLTPAVGLVLAALLIATASRLARRRGL
jgi:predicted MFS family arabinose efflux permease